jgi:hypothetical protein
MLIEGWPGWMDEVRVGDDTVLLVLHCIFLFLLSLEDSVLLFDVNDIFPSLSLS